MMGDWAQFAFDRRGRSPEGANHGREPNTCGVRSGQHDLITLWVGVIPGPDIVTVGQPTTLPKPPRIMEVQFLADVVTLAALLAAFAGTGAYVWACAAVTGHTQPPDRDAR